MPEQTSSRLLLICASPRPQGTSAMLLRRIQASAGGALCFLYQEKDLGSILQHMQAAGGIILNSIVNALMNRPFCGSALPLSLGVGYGYASFLRLCIAIKNARSIGAFPLSFSIILPGPCYINTYPARVCQLLEAAAQSGIDWRGKKLYGVINGGMPYVHTHQQGLHGLALFAAQCGLDWMGGFVLGGGAMLDGKPLGKHWSAKRLVPAFAQFCIHVAAGEATPDTKLKP